LIWLATDTLVTQCDTVNYSVSRGARRTSQLWIAKFSTLLLPVLYCLQRSRHLNWNILLLTLVYTGRILSSGRGADGGTVLSDLALIRYIQKQPPAAAQQSSFLHDGILPHCQTRRNENGQPSCWATGLDGGRLQHWPDLCRGTAPRGCSTPTGCSTTLAPSWASTRPPPASPASSTHSPACLLDHGRQARPRRHGGPASQRDEARKDRHALIGQ